MKRIVIALGGNALQEAGKPATAESQLEVVEKLPNTSQTSSKAAMMSFLRTATARRSAGSCSRTNMLPPSPPQCPLTFAVQ